MKVDAQAPGTDFSATPTAGCGPLSVQFTDLTTNGPLFWNWDFGNGVTSTRQNPAVTYSAPGTYTVTLITRNKSGSNAMRKTGYITVYPYPTASFGSNLVLACAPANIQFQDQSSPGQGSITSWLWTLGDGSSSTQQNPSHSYPQTGYYNISLKVTNSGGCTNTATANRYLRVVDGVQPNFNYKQVSTSCTAPYTVNFLNQSAGPGSLTYNWTLGNGAVPASSTATNPSNIAYPASGNYTVSLQVSSSLGCSQTIQKTLPFGAYAAAISGSDTACINTPATFTNASTPAPVSMVWNFGDGTAARTSPTTKTYKTAGNYTLKLVNTYGGCADSVTRTVHVLNAPVPDFIADKNAACQPPFTVNFTDKTTGSPIQWFWDFGDGSSSTLQNPQHVYTATGKFDVKLTVTGAGNCPVTTTKTAFITIQTPTVSINSANNLGACIKGAGAVSSITPTATVKSVDPITGYNWSAPGSNEGSSTSSTPTFTYNTAGTYTLSLTVTTAGGCTTSPPATSTVTIGTAIANPDFTINPNPVCGRDPVTFSTTTPADAYSWDFGDGAIFAQQTQQTVTHSYSNPFNPATVTLTVTNHGCPVTVSHPLVVNRPFPNFGYKVNCATSATSVTFTDSSKVGSPSSYTWDFGDNTPTVTVTTPFAPPTHAYAPPGGVFNVKLTIVDGSCTQSFTKPITLAQVSPSFNITGGQLPGLAPPAVCKNAPFQLRSATQIAPSTIQPQNFIQTYIWQVDPLPANNSSGPVYNAIVPNNGPYTLKLTVIDINGCPNSATPVPIQVLGPTAHYTTPTPDGGCRNSAIPFVENSTLDPAGSSITAWSWNFGDNQTSATGPAVSHPFADTGYYHVTLKVTDAKGCADTYTQPDSVQVTAPQAVFAGPDSFYCPGVPLVFTDSSQGYGLAENWSYGDGQSGTVPMHTYANPGQTYNVTLTVTDKYNCASTQTKTVDIRKPVAGFDIADTTAICTPLQTQFTSHSRNYDSLYWNFGDGSTSTLPVTSHFYNTVDSFIAKLYVRGPGGCMDSASRRVLVLNPFTTTQFNYSPLQACDSVPVNFSITPPGYTSFSLQFGDYTADSTGNRTPFHMYRGPSSYMPFLSLMDATGCIVNINGASAITVLGAVPFFTVDKHSFCDSSIANFTDYTITNNGFATETYTFSDGSPAQSLSPGTGQFNVSNDFNKIGTWLATLKVTTNNSCTESYTDTIRVHQTPHPVIGIASLLCTGIIQFNGSITAPIVDSLTWAWNFGNGQTSGQQNPAIHMDPGKYTVTLKTSSSPGCSDTTSDNITINAIPVIKGPKEITTPLGFPITIPFTYSNGISSYIWTPAINLDCPTCPNPVATLILSTQYRVTVTDNNKCTASDTILVKAICTDKNYWLPNTFSPNGDGVNDYFYPRGTNLYNVQSFSVFNRWGQMVFQRRDFPANAQNMGWDGNFNGHPAPADAYVYIVEVICENSQVVTIHGSVTLLR